MITLDKQSHSYEIDGFPVKSVTELLKEYGLIDLSHIPQHVLERAQYRGTLVHRTIELYLNKNLNEKTLDPVLVKYLNGFKKLEKEHTLKTYAIEEKVGSLSLGVAGMSDWRGLFDDVHTIVDWKSGVISRSMAVQVKFYEYLKNLELAPASLDDEQVMKTKVIQILPDEYKIIEKDFYTGDEQDVILAIIILNSWRSKYGKRTNSKD